MKKKKNDSKNELSSSQRWSNLLPSAPDLTLDSNNSLDNILNMAPPAQQAIIIPDKLVSGFIDKAKKNTKNDIETCAVLCGKFLNDKDTYVITHVIFPKQKGSSNTVQTIKEEELIDIQEKHSIVTLGWIHTHPSQTCFLSSVDMHCQLSYQIMMPNAIAIVHAPTDKTEIFTLSPKGIEVLSNCNCQGFHRHEDVIGIYNVAKHCQTLKGYNVSFIDLR